MPGDWELLRDRARGMLARAYAPYSGFPVGAAALVDDGRIVTGCNVENAAYGVGLCAECGLASALHAGGGGRLQRVVVVGPDGQPVPPCGRCRQILFENGGPTLEILTSLGPVPMSDLLPDAFGPDELGRSAP